MLSITGAPYDTLQTVIGIGKAKYESNFEINYRSILPFLIIKDNFRQKNTNKNYKIEKGDKVEK